MQLTAADAALNLFLVANSVLLSVESFGNRSPSVEMAVSLNREQAATTLARETQSVVEGRAGFGPFY